VVVTPKDEGRPPKAAWPLITLVPAANPEPQEPGKRTGPVEITPIVVSDVRERPADRSETAPGRAVADGPASRAS